VDQYDLGGWILSNHILALAKRSRPTWEYNAGECAISVWDDSIRFGRIHPAESYYSLPARNAFWEAELFRILCQCGLRL